MYVWCLYVNSCVCSFIHQLSIDLLRFITLIDELYEAGCCLACSAVDIPDNLFVGTSNTKGDNDKITTDDIGSSGNMNGVDVAQAQGSPISELASVKELSFAFSRATSRLIEMTSSAWWDERSVPIKQ